MYKTKFWDILFSSKNNDTDEYYINLTNKFSMLDDDDKRDFKGYLNAYLYSINECIWLDMACKVINGYVSDDTSLYFNLWVISLGEEVLLNAITNPDSLANLQYIPFGNAEFEMLMMVGIDYNQAVDIESYINEIKNSITFKNESPYGQYASFEDAMSDIPNVIPNLISSAEQANFNWNK